MNNMLETVSDYQGKSVQIAVLQKGKMNLTSGTDLPCSAFAVVQDATITFNYNDSTTETQAFFTGDVYAVPTTCTSITWSIGTLNIIG